MARPLTESIDTEDTKRPPGRNRRKPPAEKDRSVGIALIIFGFCAPLPTLILFLIKHLVGTPKDPIAQFLLGDWYFAGPMLTMSLVGITLVIWRTLLNNGAGTDLSRFLPALQMKLEREGVESALRFCKSESGIIPRKLFVSALETSQQGISAMKRAMATTLELSILPELNFLLAMILAIAKIATMVGLLGTVISMIDTFSSISSSKGEDPTKVTAQAGAIGLALFATALGLMTAIPLVFTHVLFKDWISRFETRMKAAAQKLILLMQTINPKQGDAKRDLKEGNRGESRAQKQELY